MTKSNFQGIILSNIRNQERVWFSSKNCKKYLLYLGIRFRPQSQPWLRWGYLYPSYLLLPKHNFSHSTLFYLCVILYLAFHTCFHSFVPYSSILHTFSQFSSVQSQSCPTLCDPMNRSTPGLPVHHQLPEFTQTHVHWVSDAIQPSHPLLSPFPPAPNPSQHQSFPMSQLCMSSMVRESRRTALLYGLLSWVLWWWD